ncbi:MAG: ribonuclease H-like domain-containing protein [Patescibacteria group bacterium]
MKKVVFDIETSNVFADVGKNDASLLDISVVGVYDYATDKYYIFEQNEFKGLWPILENADLLIGFNSEHFDMPLLNKYYSGDLTKIRHLDILKEIRNSFGRRMKLDQIAEGTLGIRKSGQGMQATVWWKNGEHEKVKRYCLDDVKITKDVFDYAVKNNQLKFKEDGKIIDIPLVGAEKWAEPISAGAMTFSMPF